MQISKVVSIKAGRLYFRFSNTNERERPGNLHKFFHSRTGSQGNLVNEQKEDINMHSKKCGNITLRTNQKSEAEEFEGLPMISKCFGFCCRRMYVSIYLMQSQSVIIYLVWKMTVLTK